ncbi:MAG: ABC transporter ATP-binding protein [bacterium]|nr:ABC transporter ATP-binding protein [bacterium]
MTKIEIKGISKKLGNLEVIKEVSFSVEENEIFFLLGPSGCGKTTLLRIIAGFIPPDSGKIFLNGKDITGLPPSKRNIGIVFQNYALWPHLSVWKNISYGLEVKRYPYRIIQEKVQRILEITKLVPFKDYYPTKLSGGQQQRVALARAIINEPEVLLLDEPLSNLDAKLKDEMRTEIQRIQKETGITMIYVTHDRKEAVSTGTKIAVMNEGKIVEIGSPIELYFQPKNRFTAEFLGEINIIRGKVERVIDNYTEVITDEGKFSVDKILPVGKDIEIGFRPENAKISSSESNNIITGNVKDIEYSGETAKIKVKTKKGNNLFLRVLSSEIKNIKKDCEITFSIAPDNIIIFSEQ